MAEISDGGGVEIIHNDEFEKPTHGSVDPDEPLVIHCRERDGRNRSLAIFVHGLGGSRYATWGDFPKFLYEDVHELDVALYSYRTALRRLKLTASIDLEKEAEVFADLLRDCSTTYRRIFLIGHSMGGLLIKTAIKDLIDRAERAALQSVGGLFLLAAPQAGSVRVPQSLSWLSRDMRALRPHSKLTAAVTRTFADRVAVSADGAGQKDYVIPTWIVAGAEDFWVDSLSAGLGVPANRRKTVRRSHTGVVKPKSKQDDTYRWVRDHVNNSVRESSADAVSELEERESPKSRRSVNVDALCVNSDATVFGLGDKIRQLSRLQADPAVAVALILGGPGTGKSTLVRQFINKTSPLYGGATNVFAWSFADEDRSLTSFLIAALKFFADESIEGQTNDDAMQLKLREFLIGRKYILVLDNFEELLERREQCQYRDLAMMHFVDHIARDGVEAGTLVAIVSREKPPINAALNVETITLKHVDGDIGARILESTGLRRSPGYLANLVERLQGNPLMLSVCGHFLQKYDSSGSSQPGSPMPDIISRAEPIREILEYYDEHALRQNTAARSLMRLLALWQSATPYSQLNRLIDNAEAFRALRGTKLEEACSELESLGLIEIDDDHNDKRISCHTLIAETMAGYLRQRDLDAYESYQRALFDFFCSEKPAREDDLSSWYAAVYHGCNAGEYARSFRIYWQEISRGRQFFNVRFGDRSRDLVTISYFAPTSLSDGITEDLDKLAGAWLLAKAAFNYTALGRFGPSVPLRHKEIDIFANAGVFAFAAEDSRQLINALIPMGRLPEALEAAERAVAYAEEIPQTENDAIEINIAPECRLKLNGCSKILDKCLAAKGYVLHLMGETDNSVAILDELSTGPERSYFYSLKLDTAESDDERLALLNKLEKLLDEATRSGKKGISNLARLELAKLYRDVRKYQQATELFVECARDFQTIERFDIYLRVLIEKAQMHVNLWLDKDEEEQLEAAENELANVNALIEHSGAKLFQVDHDLIEAKLLAKRSNEKLEEALSDLSGLIDEIGYDLRRPAIQEIRNLGERQFE